MCHIVHSSPADQTASRRVFFGLSLTQQSVLIQWRQQRDLTPATILSYAEKTFWRISGYQLAVNFTLAMRVKLCTLSQMMFVSQLQRSAHQGSEVCRTYRTCLESRKKGWRHGRCRGRQNAPLDGQSDYSDSLSSSAAPRLCGNADAAPPEARCASVLPACKTLWLLALQFLFASFNRQDCSYAYREICFSPFPLQPSHQARKNLYGIYTEDAQDLTAHLQETGLRAASQPFCAHPQVPLCSAGYDCLPESHCLNACWLAPIDLQGLLESDEEPSTHAARNWRASRSQTKLDVYTMHWK